MSERLAEKRKAFDWFGMTKEERFKNGLEWRGETRHIYNRKELAGFLGVKTPSVIDGWYEEWLAWQKDIDKTAEVIGEYNSEQSLIEKTKKVDDALIKACERGHGGALRTYYQLTKRLVEESKQEVTHKLDGELIAIAIKRADKELREGNYRISEEQTEYPLLPAKSRLSSEQEHSEDG